MSDESNGRWAVEGDSDSAWPAWTVDGKQWSLTDIAHNIATGLGSARLHASEDALVALIEAAESTEPRNQPELLPLMTGTEVMEAWDRGAAVERLTEAGWERWPGRDASAALRQIHLCTIVARVVEPPAPATERVPWWEAARDRRVSAALGAPISSSGYDGDGVTPYAYCGVGGKRVPIDDDGTVEVLTEGTDKP